MLLARRAQQDCGPNFPMHMNKENIEFDFTTDKDSRAYVVEIIHIMMALFDISQEEAVGRLNRVLCGQTYVGPPEENWLYYEMPEYWAKSVYYEQGTCWWRADSPLKPSPYP